MKYRTFDPTACHKFLTKAEAFTVTTPPIATGRFPAPRALSQQSSYLVAPTHTHLNPQALTTGPCA